MSGRARTIAFAGGGSGGHLSPGLAIAERMADAAPSVRALFLCSTRAIDAQMLGDAGVDFRPVTSEGFTWKPRGFWRFLRAYAAGRQLARRILREERVEHVVSLGGFVTGPVTSAARSLGVPVTLVNLDAHPGLANRLVARRATRVISACETPGRPGFAEAIVGMPLRRAALAPAGRAECRGRLGLDPVRPCLLVTGASQGASSLNSFMVAFALRNRALLGHWQVLHLAGAKGSPSAAELDAAYARAGVKALVLPFLNEMGLAWGAAELALSRAGANSVAEAEANGVPTVFVPYPYHRDLHQEANARPLVSAGAAVLAHDRLDVAANMAAIGEPLAALLADGRLRDEMENALRTRPQGDAADAIARGILGLGPAGRVSH